MNKIKIILVDDHHIVRDGIKSLLSENEKIEIIGEATSGYELFQLLNKQIPDLILLDISLPKMSGIEVAKVLSSNFKQIKILMLSMHISEDFIFNAVKAGVKGYLPKNTTRDELLSAITEIYEGKEFFSKSISDVILKSYVSKARLGLDISKNKLNNLTNREREILQYVAEGINNPDIAQMLSISIRTVETHKTSIMKKLDLKNTVDLVKFAIKNNITKL